MNYTLEKDKLTFFLVGELNSYNSEDVEKEIEKIIKDNSFKRIAVDMKDLKYISSAGLRIIVRLKQRCDDTTLVNVPNGVYDIFKMVGFENLLKIERLA